MKLPKIPLDAILVIPVDGGWRHGGDSWLEMKQAIDLAIISDPYENPSGQLIVKNGDPARGLARIPKKPSDNCALLVLASGKIGKSNQSKAKVGLYRDEGQYWPVLIKSISGTTVTTNYGKGKTSNLWIPVDADELVPTARGSSSKEGSSQTVKISDLFVFQDNSTDMDTEWIDDLAEGFKDGEEPEPILVTKITPALQASLKVLKKELQETPSHRQYAETIDDELLTTKKKWILLDGNHRMLAALKAKLKTLPAEITIMSAKDYVNYINEAF